VKKKPQAASGGESAPLWVVSFADMVSLLMAFFVMLASFSSAGSDDTKYREFLKSLQEAFHFPVTIGPGNSEADAQELLAKLEQLSMRNFQHTGGKNEGDGRPGTVNTIKRTREGIEFTIGGQLGFEGGSADLRDEAKTAVEEIIEYIRGENNKVEVRGHATRMEAGTNKPFVDEHQLAYARACAVADFLISKGIRAERLRRVDCGSSEPLIVHAYEEQTKKANRRVEIIVTQSMVQEFQGTEGEAPAPPLAGHGAQPGQAGQPGQPGQPGQSHLAEPAPPEPKQLSEVPVQEGG